MINILVSTLTTGSRLETLQKCLQSFKELVKPEGINVDFLVVVNLPTLTAGLQRLFSLYQQDESFKLTYVLEAKPGIPFARNRALFTAQEREFKYLCFIDDDAFADKSWIVNLWEQMTKYSFPEVVTGPQRALFPEDTPRFYQNAKVYHERFLVDGANLKWAATNNLMLNTDFMKKHDLSFNESLIYGGEDKELFYRVTSKNGRIVWSSEALVSEYISQSRLNFKWALRRTFRIGATGFIMERSSRTLVSTYWICLFKSSGYLVKSIVMFIPNLLLPKKTVLDSFCDLSHSAGFIYGLFSKGRVSKYT